MNDNNVEIILMNDDSINHNKLIQVSFTGVINLPCPDNVKSERDLNFADLEDIIKTQCGLKNIKLNNARVISKLINELQD